MNAIKNDIDQGILIAKEYADYVANEVNLTIDNANDVFAAISVRLNQELSAHLNQINTLSNTLRDEAKNQLLAYQGVIDSINQSILREVNSYKDILKSYEENTRIIIKDYVQQQQDFLESKIFEIQNDVEISLNAVEEALLTDIENILADTNTAKEYYALNISGSSC